ncbi:Peptidase S8/S53 subtilisin/kexin/sedolisin [Penicillium expansum]|nr:Peptidase S8/S53 subtilisin/kexin/sedolisin [Penicillium expansum]
MAHTFGEVFTPPDTGSHLIVIFKSSSPVKLSNTGLTPVSADIAPLRALLERNHASMKLLFGQDEDRLRTQQEETLKLSRSNDVPTVEDNGTSDAQPTDLAHLPDMASFYYVDGAADSLDDLASEINQQDMVEAAYVVPSASPPQYIRIEASPQDAPSQTPNYVPRQTYLNSAPAGIDVDYAHTVPGGKGENMRVIDCEWGWRFTHEDLKELQGGVIAGTNSTDTSFVNHGTAVSGVISGDVNHRGIVGIAPSAMFSASSFVGQPTSAAIYAAAARLRKGDVILLEIHAPGPNAPKPLQGQKGFIAIEWWPDALAAIRYAVAKGIVVVEAAGNGAENLDSPIYNTPLAGFPSWWRNPFNTKNSSGAILVGAGSPPPGTHGRNHGPDLSRLEFSNWGSRVDCQGWGREVTSTGYGDLQGGISQDLWYTDLFSGTSSASPIVTGAVLSVQGVRRKRNMGFLTTRQFQTLLRSTGTQQQPRPGAPITQRIGNRPDLKQLISAALVMV